MEPSNHRVAPTNFLTGTYVRGPLLLCLLCVLVRLRAGFVRGLLAKIKIIPGVVIQIVLR